ncbi:glycosyl hydrolase [Microlunatus ginsengisoli]|uniref:glucan endo-1,3-beta-D-glucosidase n=1 Tax=Microlunatus ginsengisoli TaxID=363863 RepID=A0ABP6ZEC5_9ACTN
MNLPHLRKTLSDKTFSRRTLLAGLAVTSVAVGAAACGAGGGLDKATNTKSATGAEVFPASQVDSLTAAMTNKTLKDLKAERLADGLIPPTNRWFSGLVFGDQAQPVFPLPLSFGLTDNGFALGLPTVTATEKNIAGGYKPDISVDAGVKSAKVSAYDTLTVTIDLLDDGGTLVGKTTIAEGSPFIRYTAEQAGTLQLNLPFTASGDFWTVKAGDTTYGLVVTDGKVDGQSVKLSKGGAAILFAVPADGAADKLATLAPNAVTGSSLAYKISGDTITTTLSYQAKGDTAFAVLPHHAKNLDSSVKADLGTYPSIFGTLKLCTGTDLIYTTPVSEPTSALDIDSLSGAEKKQLSDQVTKDIAAIPAFPADTYFGGKALYRVAMLWQLATQLKLDGPAGQAKAKLTDTLGQWTDPTGATKRDAFCFVYDDQNKGVVGLTPSFGSDEFNDHHFHYGYFLYAAGVLTQDDPALAKQYAPVMNLLAADIASSAGNGKFPDRRVFDAYAGHSWASGTSPFADGNNQESSSEAITAWTGLAKWAKSSGNDALETEAIWMLSTEAQAGLAYWTNFDASEPVYSGFGHKIVPLNWGGKRDYATWFSPEPAAMLGILVIPMSPASTYLGGDSDRINANVAEATSGKFDQKFGDYLLMYAALAGESERKAALQTAQTLDDKWIDDGNSRSYLLGWLMALKS